MDAVSMDPEADRPGVRAGIAAEVVSVLMAQRGVDES
jgi:hypothetical protein